MGDWKMELNLDKRVSIAGMVLGGFEAGPGLVVDSTQRWNMAEVEWVCSKHLT